MAITPYNIIQGPALCFVAPFGTSLTSYIATDPSVVPVTTPFVNVGGTTGGITVEVDETLTDIKVDQLLDPVGARATARTIQVTTTFMETDMPKLSLALNGAVTGPTSISNASVMSLTTTTSATQPNYSTLIIDGWAPTQGAGTACTRRFIVQKVLSQPKISQKFDMANQATVAVTWTAYYVTSSTSPLTILDSTLGAVTDVI